LNYQNLPANGSANITAGDKSQHVLRGGSFYIERGYSRSAFRDKLPLVEQDGFLGFRVAARVK
jgi:formylglycine-generating enzyme required for sulfatase activity